MPAVARGPTLALASADLERLRVRVRALAENRPGVYRMLSATGRILYVGKARKIRTRLLSYFRADNHEKAARILQAAHDIRWDYAPSEFAALLGELRLIRQHRPAYNVQMNRTRRELLIKISGGAAPRVYGGSAVTTGDRLAYGPFNSMGRMLDAVACGAKLVMGGKRIGTAGYFFEPTVLTDVPAKARILTEEPFGPIAPIGSFKTFDEAMREANRLPFGLAAYAFTRSLKTATAVGNTIESGMVSINHFGLALPEVPFGGIKDSGYGSEGGSEAIEAYLNTKFVTQVGV